LLYSPTTFQHLPFFHFNSIHPFPFCSLFLCSFVISLKNNNFRKMFLFFAATDNERRSRSHQPTRTVPRSVPREEKLLRTIYINFQQTKAKSQCSICVEDFRLGEEAVQLPCKHIYHEACITSWFERNSNCPICRREFNKQGRKGYHFMKF
jgi:hypothetical protein